MIIGILGSGTMGTGIAQIAAMAGHEVRLFDNRVEALEESQSALAAIFEMLASKGKMSAREGQQCFDRIQTINVLDKIQDCNLVVEAVIEDLGVKKNLFSKIEKLVDLTCILASNTSSFSIASLASACRNPERVIGLHFFNPAPLMKLVEVIPAIQTRKGLAEEMKSLMSAWGKVPVIAKDTPAFIVNRIARPFYGEALRIHEEGIADPATIDWAMKELGSFRMGPFELMDFIGQDINYKVTNTVYEAFFFDSRYKPSFTQQRLVEAGHLGKKSGKGFYEYGQHATPAEPIKDPELGEVIADRIIVMLMNEAIDALFWGVASAEDIELAMTRGVNYPKGLLAWADEWGADVVLDKLDALYERYREDRYRASPLLRDKARCGEPIITNLTEEA